jgi:sulfite reductase alpha subunit-like flavoprotein
MLKPEDKKFIDDFLSRLNRDESLWLSGYIRGRIDEDAAENIIASSNMIPADKVSVNVYYATETGNSKALSLDVMRSLKAAGFKTKATALNRLKPQDFKRDQYALFLISTHGEGDPPEGATKFFKLIEAESEALLEGLNYGIVGLGDSSYEIFCGAAVNLDVHLKRLGASSFHEISLLDVDYLSDASDWIKNVVSYLISINKKTLVTNRYESDKNVSQVKSGVGYTRLKPITGRIKDIVNLSDHGSAKEIYHIEISYDAPITYTPGDSAGIVIPGASGVNQTPRLYSIASSPSFHEGEIHLTVKLATYEKEDGSSGYGLASGYLAAKKEGDEIDFYISQNLLFNLPDDHQDAIMIGPGTGVAPFRSFIYERSERGAVGRNWLFFGDQHAHCDFLYQAEWQEHLAMETLSRLDLAFSRDQDKKIYVQDRLLEHGDELIEWIDNGAVIYVCGSKDPMSKDVEKTIIKIISDKRGISMDSAEDFLALLEEKGRYLKDVY